ncbi:MAG: HAD family hydrolase [Candidatus Diapherotrites archaeon]|nr:HAD family hydrolase [Candidatus Diapherotrites archaeon]
MIKAILFDFGGTLTDYEYTDYTDKYIERYNEYCKVKHAKRIELSAKEVCGKWLKVKVKDPERFLLRLNRKNVKMWKKKNALKVLRELKKRGYKLGIVSNCTSKANPIDAKRFGISRYMDVEVYSRDVGVRKPKKKIYQVAMKKLGVKPKETAFVGDMVLEDIKGPKDAGIALTVLLKGRHTKGMKGVKPDYTIKDLEELLGIFDKDGQR